MKNTIEHNGRVVMVEGNRIDVEMIIEEACTGCSVKSACGMERADSKIVQLVWASASQFDIGEEVVIYIEERMGIKAATFAYIIPFFIMLAVLICMHSMGFSELVYGITALCSVVFYWILYNIFKKRIERDLVFKLRKV